MHRYYFFHSLFLFCISFLLLTGCSKSDDQRDFEKQALSEPQGITETDSNGNVLNNDPDDWRVSPMYQGLITIGTPDDQPPYPNPLPYNRELTINIYIRSLETLNRLEIHSYKLPEQGLPTIGVREDISSPTLETIRLSGQLISGSSGGSQASGLYRILIYDGQQNVVTYGDVQIGSS